MKVIDKILDLIQLYVFGKDGEEVKCVFNYRKGENSREEDCVFGEHVSLYFVSDAYSLVDSWGEDNILGVNAVVWGSQHGKKIHNGLKEYNDQEYFEFCKDVAEGVLNDIKCSGCCRGLDVVSFLISRYKAFCFLEEYRTVGRKILGDFLYCEFLASGFVAHIDCLDCNNILIKREDTRTNSDEPNPLVWCKNFEYIGKTAFSLCATNVKEIMYEFWEGIKEKQDIINISKMLSQRNIRCPFNVVRDKDGVYNITVDFWNIWGDKDNIWAEKLGNVEGEKLVIRKKMDELSVMLELIKPC